MLSSVRFGWRASLRGAAGKSIEEAHSSAKALLLDERCFGTVPVGQGPLLSGAVCAAWRAGHVPLGNIHEPVLGCGAQALAQRDGVVGGRGLSLRELRGLIPDLERRQES